MKKIISLLLALCMLAAVPAMALAPKNVVFPDLELHWSRDYAYLCWDEGLMEGVSDEVFEPDGNLTIAQCATVAARMHVRYEKGTAIELGEPWYQPYVDYMTERGYDFPSDLSQNCTRQEFFDMMALVVPVTELRAINKIEDIPDTDDETVLRYYNAGILNGMDEFGNFRGHLTLTRGECAAMLGRLINKNYRLSFKLAKSDKSFAMELLHVPADAVVMTIGNYAITADIYTAALTHELEVAAAEHQLESRPELIKHYELWTQGTYPGSFTRYMSEIYGINDLEEIDWHALDSESGKPIVTIAKERTEDWLKYHAAIRSLVKGNSVTLTAAQAEAIETFLVNAKFSGDSRVFYTRTALEDNLLYDNLAEALAASEKQLVSTLASGEYVCGEYVILNKTNVLGERLSDVEIAFLRDGAKLMRDQLDEMPTHFYLEHLSYLLETSFSGLRPRLWSPDSMDKQFWDRLKILEPAGVSEVYEDEDSIYFFLVTNPLSDDSLMAEYCINYGYDQVDERVSGFMSTPQITSSDAVDYLEIIEFAAKAVLGV